MAIKITDNFQVNIKNPIDNRFVVGSQSIPGGTSSIYPTPFYAYRDDISSNIGFVYPGLRIWDFNDNLPYVWTGTTWSNENITGASVLSSGTPAFSAGGGYQNYITKFYDTSTVLTKSLFFDNNVHVSLGSITSVNPNNSGGLASPSLNGTPNGLTQGLHINGRIRTNAGFVGDGSYISGLNAENIGGGPLGTGTLKLPFISTNGVIPGATYVLTSNTTNSPMTQWQDILNVAPFWEPSNLPINTTLPNYSGAVLYSGQNTSANYYEFFSLVSSGLQIDAAVSGSVRIESKAGQNLGGGSASVYKQLNPTTKIHEFKTITSDFMNITEVGDVIKLDNNITSSSLQVTPNGPHGITIEIPASFEGTDYYVNGFYNPSLTQLGTRSKPFSSLQNCLDKILNRGAFNDPNINNGLPYEKWEVRTGPNATKPSYTNGYISSLPGNGAVRVIIQSYVRAFENLAIHGVTYFLEKGGYDSHIVVISSAINDVVTGQPFEYLFDTTPLVDAAPRGNPYFTTNGIPNGTPLNNNPGELDYEITFGLEGSGTLTFDTGHTTRKGFIKHKGTNSYDWLIANPSSPLNTPAVFAAASNFPNQRGSYFTLGSVGGYINFNMAPLPTAASLITTAPHISGTVSMTMEDGNPYNREGTDMIGFLTISTPTYGFIQVEGRNSMFYQSMWLNGTMVLTPIEQHMIFLKDYGSIYSDNGRIYMRRNYQNVVFSSVEYVSDRLNSQAIFASSLSAGNNGNYFRVISLGNTNATTTAAGSWKGIAQPTSWRKAIGGATSPTPYPTISVGDVFRSNGTAATGTGTIAFCGKRYLPSTHVHDIYLKNGGDIAHGGDFYTQQNTGATEGGPDTFICLENSIPSVGDTTHPNRYGRSSTFCGIAANGGGYVTNLHYNYYIKSILHTSYGDYSDNSVSFKNLKIDSSIFKGVIRVEDNFGNNWNKLAFGGTFKNCYIGNIRYGGTAIMPFSNMPIYIGDGNYGPVGNRKIVIGGTTIDLPGGFINTSIPIFGSTSSAFNSGLSVGNIYRDTTGNLKILIP